MSWKKTFAPPGTGTGSGVSDHGSLTGLDGDDHALYALADGARGNFQPPGNYSVSGHLHDDRYKQLSAERIAERPASDAASTYPLGVSILEVATAAGWPTASGIVETRRDSDRRTAQLFIEKNGALVRMRWWNETNAVWSSFAVPNAADFAAASHVGSRDGHPLATPTEPGMMSASDKVKANLFGNRIYVAPSFAVGADGRVNYSFGAAGWQATVLAPEIVVPALGSPPSGFAWRLDVFSGIRTYPPASTSGTTFVAVGFDRNAVQSVNGGGAFVGGVQNISHITHYAVTPPTLTAQFTINFFFWVSVAGTWGIANGPSPTCEAYLVPV